MSAMKEKNQVKTLTLRNVKKYIIEAKTAGTDHGELSDEAVVKIIQKLAKQGAESAEIYRSQGREDLCAEEMAQVEILREYLPRPLSEEELRAALRDIIAEVGATSPKDVGKVMGAASKRLAGKADGKAISAAVKELLS